MDKKDKSKRIVFESTTHKHAQLKVRLQYDSMTQAEFFRCLIDGYLAKDERLLEFLEGYRLANGKDSKRNANYRKKDSYVAPDGYKRNLKGTFISRGTTKEQKKLNVRIIYE